MPRSRSGDRTAPANRGRVSCRERTAPRGGRPALLARQDRQHLIGVHGVAEQPALRIEAAVPPQEIELLARLHAFGDHLEPEALPHVDDGSHERRVVGIHRQIANERLVDLERADRKLLQGRQRGVSGAEVVDRQMQPHRVELVQQTDGALRIRHQRRFGDLQLEAGRRHPVLAEHAAAARDEAGLLELPQGQVYRDPAGLGHALLPFPNIRADPIENPFADVEDEAGLLGERYELRGRDVAVARQAPAQQRFGAQHPAIAHVDLGLVQDHQLVSLQGAAQLGFEHQPLDRRRIHLRNVEGARCCRRSASSGTWRHRRCGSDRSHSRRRTGISRCPRSPSDRPPAG